MDFLCKIYLSFVFVQNARVTKEEKKMSIEMKENDASK